MAKISVIEEAKRKISFAVFRLCEDYRLHKKDHKLSNESFDRTVNDLEKKLEHVSSEVGEAHDTYLALTDLLYVAYFGKGLAEGLSEMKDKTYRYRWREFSEIASIAKEFNGVCVDIKDNPYNKENHFRLGRAYGVKGGVKSRRVAV